MRASWTFYWRFAQYCLEFGRDGYEYAPWGEYLQVHDILRGIQLHRD